MDSDLSVKSMTPVIASIASENGLHYFGCSNLNVAQDFERYKEWLADGRHGSMDWMNKHLNIRENPSLLLENSKIALVFGFPYFLGDKWLPIHSTTTPRIAQYARLRDYHKFLRERLEAVQVKLNDLTQSAYQWRITVDSAPLFERAVATKSGGGFIGKNTCLIHPKKGSYFLLGEILSTWNLQANNACLTASADRSRSAEGGCGTCKRCQVRCPTGALDQDYRIDARKCLSYWTIEHRGEIPLEYWSWIAVYIFGCDICQQVCPYNRGIDVSDDAKALVRIKETPDLLAMIQMDQAYYESIFGGTPMTRAKIGGLRRNALIAAVVKKNEAIISQLKSLENDPDKVVAATAVQAQSYLAKMKF